MDVYPEWFYTHVKIHYNQSCYLTHLSFLLFSFENEFNSSRKLEEYLYAALGPALWAVCYWLCDQTSLGAVWWPSMTGAECLETGAGSPCAGRRRQRVLQGGWSESWQVGPGSENVTELVCLIKNLKECYESNSFLGICKAQCSTFLQVWCLFGEH